MRHLIELLALAVMVVLAAMLVSTVSASAKVSPNVACGGCAGGSGFPPCNDFNTGQIYTPDGGYTYYRCTFGYPDYWQRVN